MILNVPSNKHDTTRQKKQYDFYNSICKVLGPSLKQIKMLLQSRNKDKSINFEYIYCWKKTISEIQNVNQRIKQTDVKEEIEENLLTKDKNEYLYDTNNNNELIEENKALKACLKYYL